MLYQATRQCAKDAEVVYGQFSTEAEADVWVLARTGRDEALQVKAIYRLYKEQRLIAQINPGHLTITEGRLPFVEGIGYLWPETVFPYAVTYVTANKQEYHLAEWTAQEEARLYIEQKLHQDILQAREVVYHLYENNQFQQSFQPEYHHPQHHSAVSHIFKPTPLPLKPTLGPPGCLVEDEPTEEPE